MWPTIIIGLVAIALVISIVWIVDDSKSKTNCGLWTISMIIVLTCIACLVDYNSGKAIELGANFGSLSYGKQYKVMAVADGFAMITDGKKNWLMNQLQRTWLVKLYQTNVVVGQTYIIAENPKPSGKDVRDTRILVKFDP